MRRTPLRLASRTPLRPRRARWACARRAPHRVVRGMLLGSMRDDRGTSCRSGDRFNAASSDGAHVRASVALQGVDRRRSTQVAQEINRAIWLLFLLTCFVRSSYAAMLTGKRRVRRSCPVSHRPLFDEECARANLLGRRARPWRRMQLGEIRHQKGGKGRCQPGRGKPVARRPVGKRVAARRRRARRAHARKPGARRPRARRARAGNAAVARPQRRRRLRRCDGSLTFGQ